MVMEVASELFAAGDGVSAFSSKAIPGTPAAQNEAGRGLADTLGFYYLGKAKPGQGFSARAWAAKVTTQVNLI